MKLQSIFLAAALIAAADAGAEVTQSDASSFTLTQRVIVKADAPTSFLALLHPEKWWLRSHTWSGSAANLSLDPRAGGCWCERWDAGEVEHARVLSVRKDSSLRLQGAFGPLQPMAVNGVLEFSLTQGKDGTQIDMSYRVTGADSSALDKMGPMADAMFAGQMTALKELLDAQGQAARQ